MRMYNFCRIHRLVVHRVTNFEHAVPQRDELFKKLLVFNKGMCSLAWQPAFASQYCD